MNLHIEGTSTTSLKGLLHFPINSVNYQQGRCSKGSACPFTHAAEAVGQNEPRPSVAKKQSPPPGDRQRNATIAEETRPRGADKTASS